jgi:hypothetical protein
MAPYANFDRDVRLAQKRKMLNTTWGLVGERRWRLRLDNQKLNSVFLRRPTRRRFFIEDGCGGIRRMYLPKQVLLIAAKVVLSK